MASTALTLTALTVNTSRTRSASTPSSRAWAGSLSPRVRAVRQSAYQVLVARDAATLADDTGRQLGGFCSVPRSRTRWPMPGRRSPAASAAIGRCGVWDAAGQPSAWSAAAWWEMGLNVTPWQAQWIAPGYEGRS